MNVANHIDRARVGEPAMITRRAAFALCRPAPKLRCSPQVLGPAERGADPRHTLRTAFTNLHRWVAEGVAPPPNRYPRLDEGTLVDCDAVALVFDRLPGPGVPPHRNPLRRLSATVICWPTNWINS